MAEHQVSGWGFTQAFGPHRTRDAITYNNVHNVHNEVPAYKLPTLGVVGVQVSPRATRAMHSSQEKVWKEKGAHSWEGRLETAHSGASCLLHDCVSSVHPKPACCVLPARGLAPRPEANQCVSQANPALQLLFPCCNYQMATGPIPR